jgi:hypothetical protein
MTLPAVAIVVLNYNGRTDTLACLRSLEQVQYPNMQIMVVDNNSADDSVATFRAAYPDLTIIQTGANLGFAAGNNVGISYALEQGAAYVLLLNNDTEVAPDFLQRLVAVAEADPSIGIVGPTIYYYDHPEVVWSSGGIIDWQRGSTRMAGLNETDTGQFGSAPRPVDFVTGCALLIRRAAMERAGLLDPRFFMYYEETEWCVRVAQAGFRIVHVPQAHIWHKISIVERAATPFVHYYMTRNRLLFLRAAGMGWRAWLHTLVLEYARTLISWSVRPKWRAQRPQRNVMLRAVRDYFAGRVGYVAPGK